MPQIIPGSKTYFVTYRGEMSDLQSKLRSRSYQRKLFNGVGSFAPPHPFRRCAAQCGGMSSGPFMATIAYCGTTDQHQTRISMDTSVRRFNKLQEPLSTLVTDQESRLRIDQRTGH